MNRVQNHAQHHRFKVLASVTLSFSSPVNVNLAVGNQAKPGDLNIDTLNVRQLF